MTVDDASSGADADGPLDLPPDDSLDKRTKPTVEIVKSVLGAGKEAGKKALEAGHERLAAPASRYAERLVPGQANGGRDSLAERVVRAHVMLARSEGAASGVAMTGAEVTTVVGTAGTVTIPTALVLAATDLTSLAWIQLRMQLIIAALYGHDPKDAARLREYLSLQGATGNLGPAAAEPVGNFLQRVFQRLIMRHLKGETLAAVKAIFRVAGINFARSSLIRFLPLVNVPTNAVLNGAVTKSFGKRCIKYYRELPGDAVPRGEL